MLDAVLTFLDKAMVAETPSSASHAFYDAISPHGATYLQSRIYRRPTAVLTSASHWAAGGFVARYCKADWPGSSAFNYVCFEHNPQLEPIQRGMTRYRFSNFARYDDKMCGKYWDAMSEAGIADALCATAYGYNRMIASLHIGFERQDVEPVVAFAIQTAGSVLAEKFMTKVRDEDKKDILPALSARERDALAFVAEGKTDWEIAKIFGVAESTARFHVDNARRKLDAVNRAHAVARFLAISGRF